MPTKTQAALIARAEKNAHKRVAVEFGYQARRRYGNREHAAAWKLVKAGVLELVSKDDPTPLYKPGWGQNGTAYCHTFRLKLGAR